MNQFYGMDKFLGLKIIRLEDELSLIPNVKMWNTKLGIMYSDNKRQRHLGTSKLGMLMAADYAKRIELINEIKELRFYWFDNHGYEFNRSEFKYKPRRGVNCLEQYFGKFEDMIEQPNTYEDKIHHYEEGKDYDSKAEREIGEICKALHIEQKIHVPLTFPNGQSVVMDSVMNIPEAYVYRFHEHFGGLDIPFYEEKMFTKLRSTIQSGFVPDREILYTYENRNHPSTRAYLEGKIKDFINSVI